MLDLRIITEAASWREAVARFPLRDFYHTWAYHDLARNQGEGEPRLLLAEDGDVSIALPLLLRDIPGTDWRDVTSVYGYAGPLVAGAPSAATCQRFQTQLSVWCQEQRVVSVFARLHPLVPHQGELLAGLGECPVIGETVSIDLTVPDPVQRYRESHRRRLRKLENAGFQARQSGVDGLADFVPLYEETMRRVEAAPAYFFPESYYHTFFADTSQQQEFATFILLAEQAGQAVAAGFFTTCGEIAQYHLGGTATAFLAESPMVLLFTEAARIARERGCRVLHLGGGVGCQNDSLFHFKAGFSADRHGFQLWRWLANPEVCHELTQRRLGANPPPSTFFPPYRRSLPPS